MRGVPGSRVVRRQPLRPGAAAEPRTPPQLGATAGAGPTPEAVPRGPGRRPGAGEGQAGAGPHG